MKLRKKMIKKYTGVLLYKIKEPKLLQDFKRRNGLVKRKVIFGLPKILISGTCTNAKWCFV